MIETADLMATETEKEIAIAGIEVVRLRTREMREAEDTEIEIEAEKIQETLEIRVVAEEDGMTEMADEIEIGRERKMERGMEDGIGEIEVSAPTIGLFRFIGPDLMCNKTMAETDHESDQSLGTTSEDEAEAHGESKNVR